MRVRFMSLQACCIQLRRKSISVTRLYIVKFELRMHWIGKKLQDSDSSVEPGCCPSCDALNKCIARSKAGMANGNKKYIKQIVTSLFCQIT